MRNKLVCLIIILIAVLTVTAPVWARKYALTASRTVPAASGDVQTHRDKNGNTDVDLRVRNLAHPSSLTPSATTYVVWFQQSGAVPLNQGELKVTNKLEGELKAETPWKTFDLLITAENDPAVKTPTGQQVLNANIQE